MIEHRQLHCIPYHIYFIQTWPSDVKKLKRYRHTQTQNYVQIWQAETLSTWLLSSGQDIGKKFFDSKHVLNVYVLQAQ